MAETDEQAFDESITLNIVHHFPEGVNLTFSDNIAVQHTPTEFIITFSQVQQPIVGRLSDYEDIDKVKAEVVARIVLTPAKMVEFIKSLQENWTIYQRRMKALMEARNVSPTEPETANNRTGQNQPG